MIKRAGRLAGVNHIEVNGKLVEIDFKTYADDSTRDMFYVRFDADQFSSIVNDDTRVETVKAKLFFTIYGTLCGVNVDVDVSVASGSWWRQRSRQTQFADVSVDSYDHVIGNLTDTLVAQGIAMAFIGV